MSASGVSQWHQGIETFAFTLGFLSSNRTSSQSPQFISGVGINLERVLSSLA